MIEFEERKKIDTHLNIAPLIDVVFQLLIFFALSSQLVVHRGIKINLPTAMSAKTQNEQNIVIAISQENNLYLDKEQVSMDTLAEKLEIKLLILKKKAVVISADEKVDLGLAVKVMDIARQSGSEELSISAKAKDVQ